MREQRTYVKDGGVWPINKFATPQKRDYRIGETSRLKNNPNRSHNLNDQIGGKLNPDWVEWLMGLPIGWSSTRPLDKEQYKRWLDLINKNEWWIQEPPIPRRATGVKRRINRLKILGNGIVPSTLKVFLTNKKAISDLKDNTMKFDQSLMPKESNGICRKCKVFTLLGDGYCAHCWDKRTGAARTYVEVE